MSYAIYNRHAVLTHQVVDSMGLLDYAIVQ
jgi:hypothetical protein